MDVTYRIKCSDGEKIEDKVEAVCLEQTVEITRKLIPQSIQKQYISYPIDIHQVNDFAYDVTLRIPNRIIGKDFMQFLNVLYGNISLMGDVCCIGVDWLSVPKIFKGPKIGVDGLRKKLKIYERPLICGVLKPIGLKTEELAQLAYDMAMGGIDLIKDDHGLLDQDTAPFIDRLNTITQALDKAAIKTGKKTYYIPNISSNVASISQRYIQAKEKGAIGVLIYPHWAGIGTMYELANSDVSLAIMAHPSGSGVYRHDGGILSSVLYGELWRAFGADMVIYPHCGGRFQIGIEECHSIEKSCLDKNLPFKCSWPVLGGGVSIDTISSSKYDNTNIIYLFGRYIIGHPKGTGNAIKEILDTISV